MTARDTILGRIRDALVDVPADETPDDVPLPRAYHRSHADVDAPALFAERVADYRARVVEATADTARATIAELLAARSLRALVVPPGFPEDLVPDGAWRRRAEPLDVGELEAADGVLTTCAVGIAVTGTLVLDAGPGQGRRALTLLPDYHLCVVRADQIVGDVPDAIARLDPSRPLTFISGPSATSDIELDRVEGVHGPRTLEVLIVRPSQEHP
ncbi:LutC/YkgG family protein [Streptacidiphilus jiangxiensis]|uniref:L-lactate dehydrogenase complex protein LldG n=1 Tax=Streptacidiphilus jiangxiensis TaxID=235985 RepID=A0A1H7WDU2_STRJI|nr:LUD domain-containing protein [Streptacidiphilus jiangxiensis]SEM19245.1 L-lactate dehydrogenase complex protein LldG [Streptacidiphilus jiangxiensis]